MTNNLKEEIENILDFMITYRFYDEAPNIQGRLLEFRGKITEETSERILTLINQKEKEAYEECLGWMGRRLNKEQIAELIDSRIKQLKEELKGGK